MSIGARGQSGQTSEPASGRQTDVNETGREGRELSHRKATSSHPPPHFTFRYFLFLATELSE